jgi:cellulose synthase (UDP-forming)
MEPLALIAVAALAFGPVLLYLASPWDDGWRRLALLAAGVLIARYFYWRLGDTVPWGVLRPAALYMQLIALIEMAWFVEIFHAFSFFWASRGRRLDADDALSPRLRSASVDVFIPTLNEGPEIVERTILASQRLDWDGAVTVYVLDDGRREWLRELCARLGVRRIARPENLHAKAGNVNHALGKTRGEFILMLDADFLAHPQAIRRLMPAMAEPRVAVAQAPQLFYNQDPVMRALGTGDDVGDDQNLFFDRILPARDRGGVGFFCGTCALVRREALLDCGGMPTASVTEDMLLSVRLRSRGWVTRFIEVGVAIGLAPETLHAMFVQRRRWARGAIQILFLREGLRAKGLRLRDRFAFLPVYWVLMPTVRVASLAIPQLYLLFGWLPLENATMPELLNYHAPVVVAMIGLAAFVFRGRWSPFLNGVWNDVVALRLLPSIARALVFPFRDMTFRVTPKGRAPRALSTEHWMGGFVAIGVVLTLASLLVGPYTRLTDPFVAVSVFWAAVNLGRLLAVLAVFWSRPPEPADPVIRVRCAESDGFVLMTGRETLPLEGWQLAEDRLHPPSEQPVPHGRLARRSAGGRPSVLATVLRDGRLQFGSAQARGRLLSMLVAQRVDTQLPYRPARAVGRLTARMFGLNNLAKETA